MNDRLEAAALHALYALEALQTEARCAGRAWHYDSVQDRLRSTLGLEVPEDETVDLGALAEEGLSQTAAAGKPGPPRMSPGDGVNVQCPRCGHRGCVDRRYIQSRLVECSTCYLAGRGLVRMVEVS